MDRGLFILLVVVASIVGAVICGAISATIASNKGHSGGGFFLLGLFFGVIGIIAAAIVSSKAKAPPGMRSTTCPRCNAVQNVDVNQSRFECWQCHLVTVQPVQIGWHPDPDTPAMQRWFDGKAWGDWTRPIGG